MRPMPTAHYKFAGEIGRRVDANVNNWLLRAPDANPGMLDMFRTRDTVVPDPPLVPWAGEFAGKYLISAIQALDMTDDPRLEPYVANFVSQLIACQAEDGYLGPFPKKERLLDHWDLWGHYHCMLGLLMWYDRTGDERALQCAERAADLMCDTYIDTDHRPVQAGAPETNNLAVVHVLANLYRRTGNPRYLQLVRVIEEDMTTVGDWLRQGDAGVPFHLLNGQGSRWESLHIVQGLAEIYRLTGDDRYKKAVLSLWESLRRYDRHPSGAFSTFERAVGSVYAAGGIETCCSIGWTALTLDVLELTGDPRAADELELTTWNQVLAAQHPTGEWCTYDTPLDGIRGPSFQQISFQARANTPELNCCSTNGPRGLGILRSWAVMEDASKPDTTPKHPGVVVNFYGPGATEMQRGNGNPLTLTQDTRFPLDGAVRIELAPQKHERFPLRLRIPAWSKTTTVSVNGKPWKDAPKPGTYLTIKRRWKEGDTITLNFDMALRTWTGAGLREGHAAIYAGPLLLSFDRHFNDPAKVKAIPTLDLADLKLELLPQDTETKDDPLAPMGRWKTVAADGTEITLIDFASAGAYGSEYTSWLPVLHAAPPAVILEAPANQVVTGPGLVVFQWAFFAPPKGYTYELTVATDPEMKHVVLQKKDLTKEFVVTRDVFTDDGQYYWNVRSVNAYGANTDADGPWSFTVDHAHAPFTNYIAPEPGGPILASPMDGTGGPSVGLAPKEGGSMHPAADRFGTPDKAVEFWWYWSIATMRYRLDAFPNKDYTFSLWICPAKDGPRAGGDLWLFSGWTPPHSDPLRLVLHPDGLSALIEVDGKLYGTDPVAVEAGKWTHVAVVKAGSALQLYLDGKLTQTVAVPEVLQTDCTAVDFSSNPCNPAHAGRFVGRIDDFALYPRALSEAEVQALAAQ